MKTWHKIAIGTAAALSLGAIGYAIYEAHKTPVLDELSPSPNELREVRTDGFSTKNANTPCIGDTPSDTSSQDLNVCDIMDEVLVDTMNHIITYSKIAAQVAQERPEEKQEFSTQIRKQCSFLAKVTYNSA